MNSLVHVALDGAPWTCDSTLSVVYPLPQYSRAAVSLFGVGAPDPRGPSRVRTKGRHSQGFLEARWPGRHFPLQGDGFVLRVQRKHRQGGVP